MDFSLSEIQLMLADSIDKFVSNDYAFEDRQRGSASDSGYSRDVWQQFAELGWTAVPFGEDDGGLGGNPVDTLVVMERLGRALIVEPYLANVVLAGGILKRAANDTQKDQWLHPLIAGELQASLAFMEPQARYEIADVTTTASRDGDSWVLNGRKGLVPNGGTAELLIVPARTSGEPSDPAGITLFAVPAATGGVSLQAYETVDGLRAAELVLQDVSTHDVIGEVDNGFIALSATVNDATFAVCAEALGIMSVLTEKTIEYTKSRVQFGVPISSFQALQHRMVDMYTHCEQTRSLLMWAAMIADDDGEFERAVHAVKYQIGTAGRSVAEEAVQLHGGMGVTWELDVAHYFKRLIAITQSFGNADWHLDRLAMQ